MIAALPLDMLRKMAAVEDGLVCFFQTSGLAYDRS